jgi:glycosyltransferase involved in cell wall biosynthesis
MEDTNQPIITVIMTMKNAEDYVYDALDSVLTQSFTGFEIIVVDDGSTDSSRKIVDSIDDGRLIIINGAGTGISDAFNLALDHAKGQYICNCDADDLMASGRLEWQVDILTSLGGDYGAVCGGFSMINDDGDAILDYDHQGSGFDITDEICSGKTRTHWCSFLIKRVILESLEGCRPFFVTAQDIDLQLRLAEACKVWFERKNSYFYRLHDSSITHTQASNKRMFYEEKARLFSLQRQQQGLDDIQLGNSPEIPSFEIAATNSQEQIIGMMVSDAWSLHRKGDKIGAVKKGILVCKLYPGNYKNWRNLLILIIK